MSRFISKNPSVFLHSGRVTIASSAMLKSSASIPQSDRSTIHQPGGAIAANCGLWYYSFPFLATDRVFAQRVVLVFGDRSPRSSTIQYSCNDLQL